MTFKVGISYNSFDILYTIKFFIEYWPIYFKESLAYKSSIKMKKYIYLSSKSMSLINFWM